MSRDYAEKEREFIESLEADTGRDLDGWMAAIGEQKFAHRNDAIDWLRQKGFLFAWASWLERIHNNGGQPIYYDEAAARTLAAPAIAHATSHTASHTSIPTSIPTSMATTIAAAHAARAARSPRPGPQSLSHLDEPALTRPAASAESPTGAAVAPIRIDGASVIAFPGPRKISAPSLALTSMEPHRQTDAARASHLPAPTRPRAASVPPPAPSAPVQAVVMSAKAFAPLAGFLVRKICETVPGTELRAGRRHIEFYAGPLPYALLAIGGRDLKLAYAGPVDRFEGPAEKARLSGLGAPLSPLLTHMISLTDARQADEAFIETLRKARALIQK